MKSRRIIQVALLLFVGVCITYLVVGELRKPVLSAASQESTTPSPTVDAKTAKVVAYYFHGNFRCVSCRKLEAVAHEAVVNGFTEELKRGDLQWRTVNVEQSGERPFPHQDYRLFSRSLVLVRFRDGKQVEYKNLAKAWELLADDQSLKKYVQSEVRVYLQAR